MDDGGWNGELSLVLNVCSWAGLSMEISRWGDKPPLPRPGKNS